jgi:hypothetical protein
MTCLPAGMSETSVSVHQSNPKLYAISLSEGVFAGNMQATDQLLRLPPVGFKRQASTSDIDKTK